MLLDVDLLGLVGHAAPARARRGELQRRSETSIGDLPSAGEERLAGPGIVEGMRADVAAALEVAQDGMVVPGHDHAGAQSPEHT